MGCWARLGRTAEERENWERLFHPRVLPDSLKIDWEDRAILMTQKGLAQARINEQLLTCDAGIVRLVSGSTSKTRRWARALLSTGMAH